MPIYKISFLINPISGGGIGKRVYQQLPQIMAAFGFNKNEWICEYTQREKLIPQTDYLLEQSTRLIAVGGDGTIGFILQRLQILDKLNTEVGIIPLGTGNDLSRSLGIYRVYDHHGLLAVTKRLIKANTVSLDIWRVNQTHTLAAYLSAGMDANILHQ